MKRPYRTAAVLMVATIAFVATPYATNTVWAQSILKSLYAERLDLGTRMQIQDDLIWVGEYNGVIDGEMGTKTIAGIKSFQRTHKLPSTGVIDRQTIDRLILESDAARANADFGAVLDEESGIKIGLPKAYLGPGKPTGRGTAWKHSVDGRFSIETVRISEYGRRLEDIYDRLVATHGKTITYKTRKVDWFVISGERKKDRKKFYVRFHERDGDIRGFSTTWDSRHSNRFERIVVAMANSFEPFAIGALPPRSPDEVASAPVDGGPHQSEGLPPTDTTPGLPPQPEITPEPAVGGPSEPLPPDGPKAVSSGTGFVVSSNAILTNAHVIQGCEKVVVGIFGEARRTIADQANDLALVFVEEISLPPPLPISQTAPGLGEQVLALGYPLRSLLADSLNATVGNISSVAGIGNDVRFLQMTAAVQPGNSGGPLMNLKGDVVGVVSAKLDALVVASKTGDIPQSVNFAIKSTVARMFLESNGTSPSSLAEPTEEKSIPAVAESARRSVLPIVCMN